MYGSMGANAVIDSCCILVVCNCGLWPTNWKIRLLHCPTPLGVISTMTSRERWFMWVRQNGSKDGCRATLTVFMIRQKPMLWWEILLIWNMWWLALKMMLFISKTVLSRSISRATTSCWKTIKLIHGFVSPANFILVCFSLARLRMGWGSISDLMPISRWCAPCCRCSGSCIRCGRVVFPYLSKL